MRFFLLDRVTEIVPLERAVGLKAVTLTDEVLHDHFPDYPLLPGTLMVEGAAQLAGYLLEVSDLVENGPSDNPPRAVLGQIEGTKFYSPVGPGDVVEYVVTIKARMPGAGRVLWTAKCREKKIARGELTFAMKVVDSPKVQEQRRALYRLWTRELDGVPVP